MVTDEGMDWADTPGQEQPPPPPAPAPAPAPAPVAPATPAKAPFAGFVSNKTMSMMIFIGLILIMVGAIMIHVGPQATNYGANDPTQLVDEKQADNGYDDMDDYQDAMLAAQHTEQNNAAASNAMNYFGSMMADIGIFLVVGVMLLAAFLRPDLPDSVRFGALFAVGLILFAIGFRR